MELSQEFDTPYWKIFTKNDFFLKLGFRKEGNYYKLYIPYGRTQVQHRTAIPSAGVA